MNPQSTTTEATDVSIVIPALNEEAAVASVVRALTVELPGTEIIVVNDGSTDLTGIRAAEAGAIVVEHETTLGYGASLKSGISAGSSKWVLFCDADGQHRAEDVKNLIHEARDADMVIGLRTATSARPLLRRPGKAILSLFANWLAGKNIPDLNSGLRIIRRDVLLSYIHLMPDGFSFSTTSTFALLKSHHRINWVPITVLHRQGKSTVRQFVHGPATIMLMLRLSVLFEPLKVFLTISGTLGALCALSLTLDIVSAGGYKIGQTTVALGLSTLLMFTFGLLCDQVSALRRELHTGINSNRGRLRLRQGSDDTPNRHTDIAAHTRVQDRV